MAAFADFNLSNPLFNAIDDLGFVTPTPIQEETFSVILSGRDVVGIAQTGTGKTLAYMLPILQQLNFSNQINPRVLVIVPTRELVLQIVQRTEEFTKYMDVRVQGVYGGTNIRVQRENVKRGADIIVATPGRLYDLVLDRALHLKDVRKLVIDEVDVMLDLGFRFQLTNILEKLPQRRQSVLFSATMTNDVAALIKGTFNNPATISIAVSGTPLDNIKQHCYPVPNFYTKANLLAHLLEDKETFSKVLVFVGTKRSADRVFESLGTRYKEEACLIHSNKSQNYRIRSIQRFDEGKNRIMISTDVMARGLDLDRISHVINFDTPDFPENYMHRIGRTGRAEMPGETILLYTPKEIPSKEAIESLMDYTIPELAFPEEVEISEVLTPDEQPKDLDFQKPMSEEERARLGFGTGFHEKKEKNKKTNQGGAYREQIAKKYKKPKTRGQKDFGKRQKRG